MVEDLEVVGTTGITEVMEVTGITEVMEEDTVDVMVVLDTKWRPVVCLLQRVKSHPSELCQELVITSLMWGLEWLEPRKGYPIFLGILL